MKKIIYCADGTWCHPDGAASVTDADTNVYKLSTMFSVTATQLPHYDDGIGATGSWIERIVEGAFGEGLFTKIKEGYTTIAHDYEDGDAISLFGFSRGAYTARSIAGMIACAGLPTQTPLTQSALDDAFAAYRQPADSPEREASVQALTAKYGNRPVAIEMIGVWDTVGSLGIPSIYGGVDPLRYGFLNVGLSPRVHAAYQALAIDEHRAEFPPTLWDSDIAAGQTLEQVWFVGSHSNVGGGCATSNLSEITLKWMVDRCLRHGLELDPGVRAQYASVKPAWTLDPIAAPWAGYALLALPKPRTIAPCAAIADTVVQRLAGVPAYLPANLSLCSGRVLASSYQVTAV